MVTMMANGPQNKGWNYWDCSIRYKILTTVNAIT
jgi:hypothetical protein